MLDLNRLYLMDCMDGMKQFPDKYFERNVLIEALSIEKSGL